MLICAAGDIHGAMDRMYEDVLAFEATLGARFEWVLHVGDVGVWPDANRIDEATKKHDGAGDFPTWFAERRAAPRKTVFIKGNHEDFVWLDAQHDPEVLPGPCGRAGIERANASRGHGDLATMARFLARSPSVVRPSKSLFAYDALDFQLVSLHVATRSAATAPGHRARRRMCSID